jgi:hypothetical protein
MLSSGSEQRPAVEEPCEDGEFIDMLSYYQLLYTMELIGPCLGKLMKFQFKVNVK